MKLLDTKSVRLKREIIPRETGWKALRIFVSSSSSELREKPNGEDFLFLLLELVFFQELLLRKTFYV